MPDPEGFSSPRHDAQQVRAQGSWTDLTLRVGELSRAGLPLSLSLRTAASVADVPRNAESLRRAADRLDQGVPIAQAIGETEFPGSESIVATLEAGHRVADLYTVIEPIAYRESVFADLRSRMRRALVYPYCVLVVAALLAWGVVSVSYHSFELMSETFRYGMPEYFAVVLTSLAVVPIGLLVLATIEVVRSAAVGRVPFAWWGPIRDTVNDLRFYQLTSHLGVLVDHNVPLPDALEISGRAAGGELRDEADALAASIRAGKSIESFTEHFAKSPPVMRALLNSLALSEVETIDPEQNGGSQTTLSRRLHNASEMLASTAESRIVHVESARLTVTAIGLGLGVLGYALALFWPLIHMYTNVSKEPTLLG